MLFVAKTLKKVWVKMWVNCLTHTVTHTRKCSESGGEDDRLILSAVLCFFFAFFT